MAVVTTEIVRAAAAAYGPRGTPCPTELRSIDAFETCRAEYDLAGNPESTTPAGAQGTWLICLGNKAQSNKAAALLLEFKGDG